MKKVARQTKLDVKGRKIIREDKDDFEKAVGLSRKEFYQLPIKTQKKLYKSWRREVQEAEIAHLKEIAETDISRRARSGLTITWRKDEQDYVITSP